jgi:hypothetical protein
MQEAKNNFLSIVRRARIAESAGNKYVEYEIACQMRVMSQHVQKEVIHKWSVWKRYSEFELLHREIRKNLGTEFVALCFLLTVNSLRRICNNN